MALDLSLYLVTDRSFLKGRKLSTAVKEAILGGVTLVQVREKDISSRMFYEIAIEVKQVTDYYNIPLIINDRLDIAQAVNAAGVHLGQSDLDIATARKILGKDKIIGISAGNLMEALEAEKHGADYIGVGAVYYTGTKKDADAPIGIPALKQIIDAVKIPAVGIGGISHENYKDVLKAGAAGISVISAILGKADIAEAAKGLL